MSICYDYVRPHKAEAVKKWYDKEFIKRDILRCYQYSAATILPLKTMANDNLLFGRGGVVDVNGSYIEESGIPGRVFSSYEINESLYIDERVVYCGYLVPHWGHFLVEAVTRLWYFQKNDSSIDKYVFFIEENAERTISGNYREFLELLGVWNKLEIINAPTKYKEVIVPERGFKMGQYWSDEFKSIYSAVADAALTNNTSHIQYSKKVFMSRSQLKAFSYKEFNMDVLDDFFQKNGYKVVFPEKESLSDLIRILCNAETVATLSGSIQHNLLFAGDTLEQIVLEKTAVTVDFVRDITRLKGFKTTLIDANICVYPVNIGFGPFIMCYSGMLQKFAEAKGYLPADPGFENKKRMKKILCMYFKAYKDAYQKKWYMEEWEAKDFALTIREAVNDGYTYFEPYLSGKKPFLITDYFNLRFIKRLIRK